MNIMGKRFENSRLDMEIFVYEIDGKEWFMATEICKLLEHSNSRKAVNDMVWEEEKITKHIDYIELTGGVTNGYTLKKINNERTFVTETGLYQLIFRSRVNKARDFQKWVFEEVLPSLRKKNFYIDKNQITKEQVDLLKECLFDLCEDGKIALGKASMRLFGDKSELKKRLINSGFLDYDNCTWKQKRFKASNGEIYELFACNVSTVVEKGLAKSTLQVSLTNAGFIWLKDKINKDKDFGNI